MMVRVVKERMMDEPTNRTVGYQVGEVRAWKLPNANIYEMRQKVAAIINAKIA